MSDSIALDPSKINRISNRTRELRDQYEKLVIRLARPLKKVAIKYAYPDEALAEDLVQHAFLTGYQFMLSGKFTPSLGAYSWFSTVIVNEFHAQRRKNSRIDHSAAAAMEYEAAVSGSPDPHVIMTCDTLSQWLQDSLSELPTEQRICIELVDLAEYDYREAARLIGVPIGTVRSRLARARMKMASTLSQRNQQT